MISFLLGGNIEDDEMLDASLSLFLVINWFVYLKWYSVFDKRDSSVLKVGATLPWFELEDFNNKKIRSSFF